MESDKTVYPDGRPREAQPKWRRDFPIDLVEDNDVARRDFTKFLILISSAFALGQIWIVVLNALRRARGELPLQYVADIEQVPVGAAIQFSYPGEHDRCVLVRPDEETFIAFNQKCTHLACGVQPSIETNQFICPCHRGFFDLRTGRPLEGPPRRPLVSIRLERRQGALYAAGEVLRT